MEPSVRWRIFEFLLIDVRREVISFRRGRARVWKSFCNGGIIPAEGVG